MTPKPLIHTMMRHTHDDPSSMFMFQNGLYLDRIGIQVPEFDGDIVPFNLMSRDAHPLTRFSYFGSPAQHSKTPIDCAHYTHTGYKPQGNAVILTLPYTALREVKVVGKDKKLVRITDAAGQMLIFSTKGKIDAPPTQIAPEPRSRARAPRIMPITTSWPADINSLYEVGAGGLVSPPLPNAMAPDGTLYHDPALAASNRRMAESVQAGDPAGDYIRAEHERIHADMEQQRRAAQIEAAMLDDQQRNRYLMEAAQRLPASVTHTAMDGTDIDPIDMYVDHTLDHPF